jgi:hypothetical protein
MFKYYQRNPGLVKRFLNMFIYVNKQLDISALQTTDSTGIPTEPRLAFAHSLGVGRISLGRETGEKRGSEAESK